jgi:hypothetical protein
MKIISTILVLLAICSTAYAQVTATITVSPNDTICVNQQVTYTATITGCSSTSYTIDWNVNGFIQNTCLAPCSTWTTNLLAGTQQVWAYINCSPDGNDASNVIIMQVYPCTGVEEIFGNNITTIYPNPSSGNLSIDFLPGRSLHYSLFVFNQEGNQIEVNHEMKTNSILLNTSQLPGGLYYFKLTDEKGKKYSAGKFVLAK